MCLLFASRNGKWLPFLVLIQNSISPTNSIHSSAILSLKCDRVWSLQCEVRLYLFSEDAFEGAISLSDGILRHLIIHKLLHDDCLSQVNSLLLHFVYKLSCASLSG